MYGVCITRLRGGVSIHSALLDRVESYAFGSPLLTDCLLAPKSRRTVAFFSICYGFFMLTALRNLLTTCLPSSCDQAALNFPRFLNTYFIQTPYARVNQDFCSFIPFTGRLCNRLPRSVFPPSYDLQLCKSLHNKLDKSSGSVFSGSSNF